MQVFNKFFFCIQPPWRTRWWRWWPWRPWRPQRGGLETPRGANTKNVVERRDCLFASFMSDPLTCQLQTPDKDDDKKNETTEKDPTRSIFNRYADQVCYLPWSDLCLNLLHPPFLISFWYQSITVFAVSVCVVREASWVPGSSRSSWMTTSLTVSWFISSASKH